MTIPVNDIESTVKFLSEYQDRVKDLYYELRELTNDAYEIEQDWLDETTFRPAGTNDGYFDSIAERLDESLNVIEAVNDDVVAIVEDLIELKVHDEAENNE